MAFRDHLEFAETETGQVSLIHGMWEYSNKNKHSFYLRSFLIEQEKQVSRLTYLFLN